MEAEQIKGARGRGSQRKRVVKWIKDGLSKPKTNKSNIKIFESFDIALKGNK